jgi:ABC-type transport system substrate-binding protein
MKLQTTTNDTNQKASFATADFFQRIGMQAEVKVIPPSQVGIWRERYAYPGLDLTGQSDGVRGIKNLLHSSGAPLPERGYMAPLAPSNRGAYVNQEYDALMDRYLTTIPVPERMRLLAQLIHWQSDLQLVIPLFYTARGIVVANRLRNTTPGTSWNAHEWEIVR